LLNIAICDDLQEDRDSLKNVLAAFMYAKNYEIEIREYSDGIELLSEKAEVLAGFDLIFLDIFMEHSNGMEIAKALRSGDIPAPIIFLTTSPDYALDSYDVEALSYLLKPFQAEKLDTVLERFLKGYRPKSVFLAGRLFVLEDIVFAESKLKTVYIHFKDGTHVELREKLDTIEEKIADKYFMRCHQSYFVNLNYIKRIENEAFITTLDTPVLIRKRDFPEIRKRYYDYLKGVARIGEYL
jgi:DNA-binding LytR/AlgR family response regulator